ncbi:hypothetical protein KNU91_gp058 [Enterococcus phage nattely]|uniref:Uncharacterized protein n=1 Tax=Enterococcus phage nattely TaxID=2719593 RepID=A0A6G9LKR8_9CAUD|nr:hypothetical protein KNU91_gp058 [Enterococcus phage nattely]QIQ66225.1 hypothetical protein nattely_58 [Enterococcus phage nattely]
MVEILIDFLLVFPAIILIILFAAILAIISEI